MSAQAAPEAQKNLIEIANVNKYYGTNHVLKNINLSVGKGEVVVLLGPSGSGKSTLCRTINRLETITSGSITIDGQELPEEGRALAKLRAEVGMVFQSYNLFAHKNILDNVTLGPRRIRKMSKSEAEAEAMNLLAKVGVDSQVHKMPAELSGGQQQRVAIARALCIEPSVLLMDEPLSNLDAKLRVEMRSVIREMQKKIGITTIYVTHDQEEAMAVSDRIAVLNGGVIQHIGTPKAIYQRPVNMFVASFIGRSNLINGKLTVRGGSCFLSIFDYEVEVKNVQDRYKHDQDVVVSIRPEEFLMRKHGEDGISAKIFDCIFLGLSTHFVITLPDGMEIETIQISALDDLLKKDSDIKLGLDIDKINIFTADGEHNILSGVKDDNADTESVHAAQ